MLQKIRYFNPFARFMPNPVLPNKSETIVGSTTVPALLRLPAQGLSWLFHPLFIPLYAAWFLMFMHPLYFAGYTAAAKYWLVFRIALNMVFFPVVTVLLLKGLGFIQSFFLHTQQDRIIPYIACGIYFFWAYLVFRNQNQIPPILTAFTFGVFLASSAALIANIYHKISMHAIGMGGWLGLLLLVWKSNTMHMPAILFFGVLLVGMVCTARLLISNHQPREIYTGLLVGVLSQWIAAVVVMAA
jgi:hypothetical protein